LKINGWGGARATLGLYSSCIVVFRPEPEQFNFERGLALVNLAGTFKKLIQS
jgi:hypothetical protein